MRALRSWARPEDWFNLVLGIYLILVPALYSATSDGTASWNSYILGTVIAILALWALSSPRVEGIEWTNVVAGTWVLISPFALGFTDVTEVAANSYIVGALVLILSVIAQQRAHQELNASGSGTSRVSPS
jgi:hypothetical protein